MLAPDTGPAHMAVTVGTSWGILRVLTSLPTVFSAIAVLGYPAYRFVSPQLRKMMILPTLEKISSRVEDEYRVLRWKWFAAELESSYLKPLISIMNRQPELAQSLKNSVGEALSCDKVFKL